MTAEPIIAAARACVGTPFRHQGRLPGIALDCAGLVVHVATANGFECADVQGYPRRPNGGLLAALDAQPSLCRVDGFPQAGDVVVFHYEDDKHEGHLGIATATGIIHAWAYARKVAEHDWSPDWKKRIYAVYRFVGVSHGD
jgi:cell wall-associated NlpC family hydrolase